VVLYVYATKNQNIERVGGCHHLSGIVLYQPLTLSMTKLRFNFNATMKSTLRFDVQVADENTRVFLLLRSLAVAYISM
jgi:hypothetical protein